MVRFFKTSPHDSTPSKILGNYIVDFYIASEKVVIELDGSQHYEESGKIKDEERDAYLRSIGCTILRYSNADVNQRFRSVCEDIYQHLRIEEV